MVEEPCVPPAAQIGATRAIWKRRVRLETDASAKFAPSLMPPLRQPVVRRKVLERKPLAGPQSVSVAEKTDDE